MYGVCKAGRSERLLIAGVEIGAAGFGFGKPRNPF